MKLIIKKESKIIDMKINAFCGTRSYISYHYFIVTFEHECMLLKSINNFIKYVLYQKLFIKYQCGFWGTDHAVYVVH